MSSFYTELVTPIHMALLLLLMAVPVLFVSIRGRDIQTGLFLVPLLILALFYYSLAKTGPELPLDYLGYNVVLHRPALLLLVFMLDMFILRDSLADFKNSRKRRRS